ncbi:MAG: hypothetical protein R3A10_08095 [Caldilineaceae bacterium]
MTAKSRKTCRDALATLLGTALVGDGKPAQAVYGYQVGDFAGASPVVTVSSAGSTRLRSSFGQCWSNVFDLSIHVFVLYSDEGSWGEDDAEDALDTIEAAVADVVLANATDAGVWDLLSYAEEPTFTDAVEIGGVAYRRETIPVRCTVKD